ncbi:MAG: hypothetical protein J7619_06235 [Dyadobacter sp.]|uniref:hypothetical protein n=1 Tax=Dyadobacter sp. TaxID=1914288 RepID=UPI001B0BA4DA|nr:hypothetical protein [Dyadobacter sp.]MBO9612273.1 hypothetical protein [Dyadobacter sp.]
MQNDAKHIDLATTGRQPSDSDFNRISRWIEQQKMEKAAASKGKPDKKAVASSR